MDPPAANILPIGEFSDSKTMPVGNAAPSMGGSSSSSSGEQSASERSGSKSIRWSQEKSASEMTPHCEQGRNNCACCQKRKFDNDWTCDIIEGCIGEVVREIGEFREEYHAIEDMKTSCKPKKRKNDVVKRIANLNEEMETRLPSFVAQHQVAVEERLQKFMAEQQASWAKIVAEAVKDAMAKGRDSPAR